MAVRVRLFLNSAAINERPLVCVCNLNSCARRTRAEHVAHPDRPDAARHTRERDVFGVESAIEKERKARPELIDRDSARSEHFRVSKTVR